MFRQDELLQKCIKKDLKAWDEFIRRFTPLVRRSVIFKLNKIGIKETREVVLDITQEIFLKIWENDRLSKVMDAASLEGWLAIVSINATHNFCVKEFFSRNKESVSIDNPNSARSSLHEVLPSGEKDALSRASDKELSDILEKLITTMPSRTQLMLKLSLHDGKKQEEIAQIMNMPRGTVATILSRAKKDIKEKIEKILKENP